MTDATTSIARPTGDFAIVEILGHSTMVGRMAEVERFGTKMLSIEPIWQDELLPAVLVGGSSIYHLTSCSAEVAFRRQAKQRYELPASVAATLPVAALPAPREKSRYVMFTMSGCENDTFAMARMEMAGIGGLTLRGRVLDRLAAVVQRI